MQELLGRITALDPEASVAIRVIACFDELIIGNVNTRALLSTAASLAGCPAGYAQDRPHRTVRMDPRGQPLHGPPPDTVRAIDLPQSAQVWIEREGAPHANDTIIVERLALAVGIRLGIERHDIEPRRDVDVMLDGREPRDLRREAACRLHLATTARLRVLAAPLFAVWGTHARGPGDVVSSEFGPVHAVVVTADHDPVDVSPAGIGVATDVDGLPRSYRSALVALRLCAPPEEPAVRADDYGGLAELLADTPADHPNPDADRLAELMAHPWARSTVDALVRATTVRRAARLEGVHHSTMQTRIETLTATLGFDPMDGYGRARLGVAYLLWRLRTSRVMELPTPAALAAR
ncbi:CdaR family transcriptional regulator [Pseudonocardia sp. CNS-139]|nr:CdaR family transcriptional regulator [Pseudonocardia sp. CNS-139]